MDAMGVDVRSLAAEALKGAPPAAADGYHYCDFWYGEVAYFRAMAANRLVPVNVIDLTADTIPYWELRQKSSVATGIEGTFLDAYRTGGFQ